jgi:hypothetical protein
MTTEKRLLKVFLCHARADKPKVRELYSYLRRRRIRPWLDEVDLVGGQDWQVEIPKALATSDAIIICLTKSSVDKEGYVQREIKFALDKALEMPEGHIALIPVRFEDCKVPDSLSRFQWVDLFEEAGYAKMMRALKFRADQLKLATVELSKKELEEEKLAREKAAREQAHKAGEKAAQEEAEREKAERAIQEQRERELAEKARRVQEEREAAEKTAKEQEERKRAEEAAREKLEREAAEKARREREKRQAAERVAAFKRFVRSAGVPFLAIGGVTVLICVFAWTVLQILPENPFLVATMTPSITPRPSIPVTSSTPTKTPEHIVLPTKSPTPKILQFFAEEFETALSSNWDALPLVNSQSDLENVQVMAQAGKLVWNINSKQVYYYLFYNAFEYDDVRLDMSADNLGKNNNAVSLVCRYDPNVGWYEFNVANNGLFDIYFAEIAEDGSISYNRIANGGSNAIRQGYSSNTYAIICKSENLTLYINGEQAITIVERKYGLDAGQIGISVSSFDQLPVIIEMDQVKISRP